jgi:hypothetical protein
MKKIVIHIGYPKTATTTLQDNVFYQLHKLEKINFFGKVSKTYGDKVIADRTKMMRGLLKAWGYGNDSYPLFEINTNLSLGEQFCQDEILSVRGLLKSNLVNIFSMEGLNQFKLAPRVLKTIFDDGKTEIKILVALRAQGKLMQSHYAQGYSYNLMHRPNFAKEKEFHTSDRLSKQFFDDSQALKLNTRSSEQFNFYNVVSSYSKIFGKENVKILLFEDLINDRAYYISQLGEICDVQDELINFYLENQKPLNVKSRKEQKYVLEEYDYNFPIQMLLKLEKSFPKALLEPNSPARLFLKNLFGKKKIAEVPGLTSDEKKAIFDFYKNSNMLLADQFGISAEKLKKYNYI